MDLTGAEVQAVRRLLSDYGGMPSHVPALRKLGTGSLEAAPGNDVRFGNMKLTDFGLWGRLGTPADVNIATNTTLTEQINYFHSLTVASGATLTGLAGGTIIVVEDTLTVVGSIVVDALGGAGGALTATSAGDRGYGGGWLGFSGAGTTFSAGDITYSRIVQYMATGGTGAANAVAPAAGGAGNAWPVVSSVSPAAFDTMSLVHQVMLLLSLRSQTEATAGGPGGGGGGSGSGSGVAVGGGTAGNSSGIRATGVPANGGGPGGSGWGAGGGGGGHATGSGGSNNSGAGGRGGGTLVIFCRALNNTGTISANGANGSAGAGTDGAGGGGGGGGLVLVCYETLTSLGTLQANGGSAGAAGGANSSAGGIGGAGLATSFRVRTGS